MNGWADVFGRVVSIVCGAVLIVYEASLDDPSVLVIGVGVALLTGTAAEWLYRNGH